MWKVSGGNLVNELFCGLYTGHMDLGFHTNKKFEGTILNTVTHYMHKDAKFKRVIWRSCPSFRLSARSISEIIQRILIKCLIGRWTLCEHGNESSGSIKGGQFLD
jgi:hypothetical protein